jgi:predicted phosphoadenosine phosphosulfate sulfurtransferase
MMPLHSYPRSASRPNLHSAGRLWRQYENLLLNILAVKTVSHLLQKLSSNKQAKQALHFTANKDKKILIFPRASLKIP